MLTTSLGCNLGQRSEVDVDRIAESDVTLPSYDSEN